MNQLQQRYPKIKFDKINELDIIYVCRDSLNYNIPVSNRNKFENEILELIKERELDLFIKDIDKNILLTYPVLNNAFKIVKYFINSNMYDLTTYNSDISSSLCAGINLQGKKMINYLVEQNVHPEYLIDMLKKAYTMSEYVTDEDNKNKYLQLASILINKNIDFALVIKNIIKPDSNCGELAIYHLLNDHPLSVNEKVTIIEQFFLENVLPLCKNSSSKKLCIEKWKIFHNLNKSLPISNRSHKITKL